MKTNPYWQVGKPQGSQGIPNAITSQGSLNSMPSGSNWNYVPGLFDCGGAGAAQ